MWSQAWEARRPVFQKPGVLASGGTGASHPELWGFGLRLTGTSRPDPKGKAKETTMKMKKKKERRRKKEEREEEYYNN